MPDYDDTNRGTLFKNNRRRDGKNDAQLNGTLNVNGQEYWINGWTRKTNGEKYADRNGDPFISISVRRKETMIEEVNKKIDGDPQSPLDDEIPF